MEDSQPTQSGRRTRRTAGRSEDGKILAAVFEIGRGDHLVILDRNSKVFADIPGGAGSQGNRGTASWRHYMRR